MGQHGEHHFADWPLFRWVEYAFFSCFSNCSKTTLSEFTRIRGLFGSGRGGSVVFARVMGFFRRTFSRTSSEGLVFEGISVELARLARRLG
jgi:hypothetical protein